MFEEILRRWALDRWPDLKDKDFDVVLVHTDGYYYSSITYEDPSDEIVVRDIDGYNIYHSATINTSEFLQELLSY